MGGGGGLKLTDLSTKDASLKVAWIPRLINCSSTWRYTAYKTFPLASDLWLECNVTRQHTITLLGKKRNFWGDVAVAWAGFKKSASSTKTVSMV